MPIKITKTYSKHAFEQSKKPTSAPENWFTLIPEMHFIHRLLLLHDKEFGKTNRTNPKILAAVFQLSLYRLRIRHSSSRVRYRNRIPTPICNPGLTLKKKQQNKVKITAITVRATYIAPLQQIKLPPTQKISLKHYNKFQQRTRDIDNIIIT